MHWLNDVALKDIEKGGDTMATSALTDALENLVRFILLPGHRLDTRRHRAPDQGYRIRRLDRRQSL